MLALTEGGRARALRQKRAARIVLDGDSGRESSERVVCLIPQRKAFGGSTLRRSRNMFRVDSGFGSVSRAYPQRLKPLSSQTNTARLKSCPSRALFLRQCAALGQRNKGNRRAKSKSKSKASDRSVRAARALAAEAVVIFHPFIAALRRCDNQNP